MNKKSTKISLLVSIILYSASSPALTIWTDADFTAPKGYTYIRNDELHIQNTQTVSFNGEPAYSGGLLSVEQGGKLIADSHVEVINTSLRNDGAGDAVLVTEGGKAYFNGGLTATSSPNNNYYVIAAKDNYSELHVVGETIINPAQYGLYLGKTTSSSFDGSVSINANNMGVLTYSNSHFKQGVTITMLGNTPDRTYTTGIHGWQTDSPSHTQIDGPLTINYQPTSNSSAWYYGVLANTNHTMDLQDVSISFDDAYTNGGEIGLYATGGGIINSNGDLNIQPSNTKKYALYANNNGQINANGLANIKGLVYANGGNVSLDMYAGSQWTGAANYANNGNLMIKMQNTIWDMTQSSNITDSIMDNSIIRFNSSLGQFFTLKTNTLGGNNNTFHIKTDLSSITTAENAEGKRVGVAGVNGDLIVINNTVTNNQQYLTVQDQGSASADGKEVLQIVSTPTDNIGNFALTSAVDLGGYQYNLRESVNATGQNVGWELYSDEKMTNSANNSLSLANINYLMGFLENQTLLQRMGELHKAEPNTNDVWVKTYLGDFRSFDNPELQQSDVSYWGLQIGADKLVKTTDDYDYYVGIMAGLTRGSIDYHIGDGDLNSYYAGIYSTYKTLDGFYLDLVGKYNHTKNKFNTFSSSGEAVIGKGSANGYSFSIELGKRQWFDQEAGTASRGLYLEPQAQLTLTHQEKTKVHSSNGLTTTLSNYLSALGRVSSLLGYRFDNKDSTIDTYVKLGYLHEFDGDIAYQFNDAKRNEYSFHGDWLEMGLGVTALFRQNHNIYFDVNYDRGSRFNHRQINLGYRYSF